MKSIARKTFTILEWIIIAAIIAVLIIVTSALIPGSYIGKSYIIVSSSMEPTVPLGSMVVTMPQPSYAISDVIAFESPEDSNKIIMHRAYLRSPDNSGWITKGDGNEEADNWVIPDDQIKGRAIAFIPHIGRFASEARTPQGFLLYIGIPVLLIIILYCVKIIRGVKEYARQEAAKAVEQYRKTHSLRQITLSLTLVIGFSFLLTARIAHAVFSDKVTTQMTFTTASSFNTTSPTASASPTIQPTVLPTSETSPTPEPTATPTSTPTSTSTPLPSPSAPNGVIILNQTGASSTINVNATTQGGSQSIQINNQQTSQQSQSVTVTTQTSTTNSQPSPSSP